MRQKELQHGIAVYNDDVSVGKSSLAAKHAISQTAISRVIAGMPSMVLAPVLMGYVNAKPKPKMFIHAGVVGICMGIGLPLAISLFDQTASISGTKLEPEFHKYEKLYFNRGL
eukprot:NODE_593_length_6321_cov_0.361299.p4 type:complete len:113 gc:universal NODE_593_length_6321_cov_0.361299:914-1252(+)